MTTLRGVLEQVGVVVEYDPDFHVYRVDGDPWPSVTQALDVITDFGNIPAEILKRAADRGTRVHQFAHRLNTEDAGRVMDELRAEEEWVQLRVMQYADFLNVVAPDIVASEALICNVEHRYCGRGDLIARPRHPPGELAPRAGRLAFIDLKTGGLSKTFGPQLAGYAAGWPFEPIEDRYVLQVTDKGWKLLPYDDPWDFDVFLSCLNIWRFKNPTYTAKEAT